MSISPHAATPLPDAEYLDTASVDERQARGRSRRAEVSFEALAAWNPAPTREDPVQILRRQAATRAPELVPIRYGRMLVSPFAFYRGGAGIMAADLSTTHVAGLRAQLCGDAHLLNFGIFDTPERSLVFGLNDFDETLPGPVEWDLKRLAVSIEIAGRDLSFSSAQREHAVLATVRAYREAMLEFAEMRNLDVWYARMSADELRQRLSTMADRASSKEAKKRLEKALRRDHLRAFERHLEITDGQPKFVSDPPVLVPAEELLVGEQRERYVEVIQTFLQKYRASLPPDRRTLMEGYRFVALARKVVGVGSVGTRAWVVLMEGRDANDPLLLQLKEAQPSVLAPYAGATTYECEGRRVVEGQRLMQAASDHLLGWYDLMALNGEHRDFYVRQLWDGKASIDVAHLTDKGLAVYGQSCGWTLARGHARSGDRVALAAYLGDDAGFDQAIAAFSTAYAATNEADHARLAAVADAGEIEVVSGV
jgi:uncharacterized protein (DUF2252 family)